MIRLFLVLLLLALNVGAAQTARATTATVGTITGL